MVSLEKKVMVLVMVLLVISTSMIVGRIDSSDYLISFSPCLHGFCFAFAQKKNMSQQRLLFEKTMATEI